MGHSRYLVDCSSACTFEVVKYFLVLILTIQQIIRGLSFVFVVRDVPFEVKITSRVPGVVGFLCPSRLSLWVGHRHHGGRMWQVGKAGPVSLPQGLLIPRGCQTAVL